MICYSFTGAQKKWARCYSTCKGCRHHPAALSVMTLRGGLMRVCVPAGAYWSCHPRVSKHIRLLPAACLHIHCHDGTGNLFLYSACSCPPQQNNRWGMAPAPVILRVFRRKTRALSWYNIKFFLQLLFIKNPTGIRADYFQIFI